jgi:hypothetical protein
VGWGGARQHTLPKGKVRDGATWSRMGGTRPGEMKGKAELASRRGQETQALVAHTCNPSTQEVEEGGTQVQDQPE